MLPGFADFYRVSRTFTGFHGGLLEFVFRVLEKVLAVLFGCNAFHGVLPGFADFYRVSRTFTGFHGGLLEFVFLVLEEVLAD